MIRALFDFLLPKTCVGCGEELYTDSFLCLYCASELPEQAYPINTNEVMCARYASYLEVKNCFYWLNFEKGNNTQKILHAIKYSTNPAVAHYFGKIYAKKVKRAYSSLHYDYIVPVPLFWKKYWTRGFNQAYYIAKGFLDVGLSKKILSPLEKTKSLQKQNKKSKKLRLALVSKLFVPKKKVSHQLKNKKILLIDDVYTTGATFEACVEQLKEMHVNHIDLLVIGKTIH